MSTKDSNAVVVAGFFAFPLIIGMVVAGWLWRAYVLLVMWAWFVVPLFGLPALRVPYAIGVIGVFSMLKGGSFSKSDGGMGKTLSTIFIGPAVTLLVGWIATKFI